MAEVAAGDEGGPAANFLDRLANAFAKANMLLVRKKTVPQGDDPAAESVPLQKVKRDRGAMIEILFPDFDDEQFLSAGGARDLVQQFVVEFCMNRCRGRAKVCEVAVKLGSFVGDESRWLERRVRRNDHDGLSATADHALS